MNPVARTEDPPFPLSLDGFPMTPSNVTMLMRQIRVVLRSWLWTPTDYLFLLSNLSTFYLPFDHPISPSLTSTTQTPIVCLRFYCSSLCIVSHSSFHTVDIPNALFHFLLLYHTTPDLVQIRLVVDRPLWTSPVYIRRPLLRKLGLKPDLVQS